MSKEIKIGLIGAGWMGKAHTTAFHNARMIFGDDMPVFELVSDVSEDAVAKFAKNMGYNRYTTNWMDVVADPEIDLVDVATPNCMHYEMAKVKKTTTLKLMSLQKLRSLVRRQLRLTRIMTLWMKKERRMI